jgi:outer membrane protein TolC
VRHQEGTSVILDVTRARVNVSAARLALVKSQDQVRSDSVTLAQIMGLSKTVFLVAADLDRDPNAIAHPDPDRDMSKALSHRPEWKEATADLESAKATLKNSKAQNYPSITALGQSFTATLPSGALPFTYIPNNYPYSTFSIGGTLTVPIFEGGYMVHQTARARADVMTARDNREATRLSIATDLKKAALSITDAKEQLDWALTSLDNARKNEMLVQEAYRMGQVQSVDVMDAQTALRQARESVIRARYLLMNSNVLYRYAVGTLAAPEAEEHAASGSQPTTSGQIR